MSSTHTTPPKVAKRYGVSEDKVLGWINRGELRAINVAARLGGRPRWRIPEDAIVEFEAARSAQPSVRTTRRRRKQEHVIQFF
jgi:transposase